MFDRCCKGDARIHREIPHRTPEAKAVNQIKCDGHVNWIDCYNLVMHLRVVHISVGKIDLAGSNIECHHGCIVNYTSGICDTDKGAIVSIPNRAWRGRCRGEFGSRRSGYYVSRGLEIHRAFIKYDISIAIQIACSGSIGREVEFGGEVQPKFRCYSLVVGISEDVPDSLIGTLQASLIERNRYRSVCRIDLARVQELNRSHQTWIRRGRRRAKVRKRHGRTDR